MTATEPELLEAARAVQANAHAPHSRFLVGAALRTPSGSVFTGCNVENAAYPQGTCAEAGAIAAMVAAGERAIDAILTVADGELLATPLRGVQAEDPGIRDVGHGDPCRRTRGRAGDLHDGRAATRLLRSREPRLSS